MPTLGFDTNATSDIPIELGIDQKHLTAMSVKEFIRVPKLTALLDGLAIGGSGDGQPISAVVYDEFGQLLSQSKEIVITVGQEPTWTDLVFPDRGGIELPSGNYAIGLIAGGPSATARIAATVEGTWRTSSEDIYGAILTSLDSDLSLPASTISVESTAGFDEIGRLEVNGEVVSYGSKDSTTFKDCVGGTGTFKAGVDVVQSGASSYIDLETMKSGILGSPGAVLGKLILGGGNGGGLWLFATYFRDVIVPDINDEQIAQYPFSHAQSIFRSTPPLDGSGRVASCTWHGTKLHPARGSFVLVQRDGSFVNLVGQRIRVSTFGGNAVYAYVIAEADLNEEDDISLTRRLFMVMAPLATESLGVHVERLSLEGED